jgi:hypothetical protein
MSINQSTKEEKHHHKAKEGDLKRSKAIIIITT